MNRWVLFLTCAVLGLGMLVAGLLMPAHLRAVDDSVIQRAGRNTPTLTTCGLALADEKHFGAAQMLLQAAQVENVPGWNKLAQTITDATGAQSDSQRQPFTEFIIHTGNREPALAQLGDSQNPAVQELMRCRALTNTALFSPSSSASGQAFDAALAICGLLVENGNLTPDLAKAITASAADANRGGDSQNLELALLDLMSLGQRFNWDQLAAFAGRIDDVETLHTLTDYVRKDADLPALFAAVELSGKPADVARYLTTFSDTGVKDLQRSLRYGTGGVDELLRRGQRLHVSSFDRYIALDLSLQKPWFALTVKWVLYLSGGFLLAMSLHFARRPASVLEKPLQVRGFHYAREALFALGFLLFVLLLSEPFLAQDSQKGTFSFRLRLPTVGSAVTAGNDSAHSTIMNQVTLLTMLLFFVLQALLYSASLVKLAEIRRQNVAPRVKLKLLENEDHLFDAGLYLGFLGTIISLILVSLGVFKQPSLMAAYSSTSFGILFVVLFKVVHLRTARRKFLLEAESEADMVATAASQMFTVPL